MMSLIFHILSRFVTAFLPRSKCLLITWLKLQYFGHWMQRTDSFEKTLMLGKIEGRRKRAMEDEMVGWHHQLNGYELEQILRDSKGQGGLACFSTWGCKESDMTESLYNNNVFHFSSVAQSCPTLCDTMDSPCQAFVSTTNSQSYLNSCPSSRWCHPTISSSIIPFSSHIQSFPA